jgi:hypothetical protein
MMVIMQAPVTDLVIPLSYKHGVMASLLPQMEENGMGVQLDRRGQAVMAALAAGRKLSDTPGTLVDLLVRHDLARMEGGCLVATAAGRGWSVRDARPEGANRMLAERTLPTAEGGGRRVTVNLGESPLGWLRARGHVSARQYEAGDRLRGDWEAAQLAPRVTMRWDAAATPGGGGGAGVDPTAAQIGAKRRFDAAAAAAGPGLADVLWRVVCAGEGLEAAERALGWPKRSGKLVLGLALDRVAGFYGLG